MPNGLLNAKLPTRYERRTVLCNHFFFKYDIIHSQTEFLSPAQKSPSIGFEDLSQSVTELNAGFVHVRTKNQYLRKGVRNQ